ncbi:helix-turn-helix domain-containing protein [Ruminococcus albus]|uniref:DNA-binding helix-turn-helix protein n=1 Tax=Ruminococcus albus 8 TaxID=246199 RepID=E9SAB0_RUMAL|nr:helix-turn-helix transcriptional regulator [Ruminococcus albus]EGC03782.1 DNA-binding helix-turn-helix protein [Ruminococcus albus 8]MCC3351633.1 helix-turn-helix transcriptional regulator [Ruminococcus albus 8]
MTEEHFKLRIAKLRTEKGVSARDMSLSLGQNAGYINNIETGKALPSMAVFFAICDYLNITPMEFFDEASEQPEEIRRVLVNMKKLNKRQLNNISEIVEDLTKK